MNGLILGGGFSTRMGMEKSHIDYHGMPQYEYLYLLLKSLVDEVFISCRKDQVFEKPMARIDDVYADMGPMSGVLSAFELNDACGWLVVAVDLPLVDKEVLQELITRRDTSRDATYFIDPQTNLPEPLLAIYEPSIYILLKKEKQEGQFSLNKILQKCKGNSVVAKDSKVLRSVNTLGELDEMRRKE